MAPFPRLRSGDVIKSPVSGHTYRVQEKLGVGSFGAAYRVRDGNRDVCLKITDDTVSWHREAYMAELLDGHPRVVAVVEAFPVIRPRRLTYATVMELADGTVEDAVAGGPWPEKKVIAEIRGLLSAVAKLHDSGAVHRDITPFNVFLCGPKKRLKLGDFGIARHGSRKWGVAADEFAPWFADSKVYNGNQVRWTAADDLWQVGQIAAVLLTGEVAPIHTRQVRDLPCSDALKLAIRRAIGEPGQRFLDARAMSDALSRSTPLSFGSVRSLEDKTVVFTGPLLLMKRAQAVRLAVKAGARVLDQPSGAMDVLVVGSHTPSWIAGRYGGIKILETLALQERGYQITMVTGQQFCRLVRPLMATNGRRRAPA